MKIKSHFLLLPQWLCPISLMTATDHTDLVQDNLFLMWSFKSSKGAPISPVTESTHLATDCPLLLFSSTFPDVGAFSSVTGSFIGIQSQLVLNTQRAPLVFRQSTRKHTTHSSFSQVYDHFYYLLLILKTIIICEPYCQKIVILSLSPRLFPVGLLPQNNNSLPPKITPAWQHPSTPSCFSGFL